jgi:hypothetical protein
MTRRVNEFPQDKFCSNKESRPEAGRPRIRTCECVTAYPSVTTCVLPNMPTELRPCWVLRQRQ